MNFVDVESATTIPVQRQSKPTTPGDRSNEAARA